MSLSREIRGLFFLCIRIDSPIGVGGGSIRPTTPAPYPQIFFVVMFDLTRIISTYHILGHYKPQNTTK